MKIPAKLAPLLEPMRFKVMHGGRGGGKSHTVAQVLIMLSMQSKLRILCVREVQKSLKQSSMKVLEDYIERLGLAAYFQVLKTEIRCKQTGSTFEFSGLKDHTKDSIKSWEGADIVWCEEAHSISAVSWNTLIPTIRKAGSEIWVTFNPDQDSDYAYKRWVIGDDPQAWVVQINHRDNPWFGEEMETERLALKAANDDLYQHVWEGKCRSAAGLMFKRVWFNRYEPGNEPAHLSLYMGSDYAATDVDDDDVEGEPDYTEHGVAGLDENGDLYFIDWWSGQTDPEVWIKAAVQLIKRRKPQIWFEEAGPIARAVKGALNKRLRETDTWVVREALPSASNKAARAMGFAARAAAGAVWIPNNDWGDRLINQLCAFTGKDGKVDDMVDVCSIIARGMDQMADARVPRPIDKKPIIPFSRAHIEGLDRADQYDEAERRRFYR